MNGERSRRERARIKAKRVTRGRVAEVRTWVQATEEDTSQVGLDSSEGKRIGGHCGRGDDRGLEWGREGLARYRFRRGNDGDRGAAVTMVGTNLDTQVVGRPARGSLGCPPPPTRSLTLETTGQLLCFIHGARHLLAHGRCVCQRAPFLPSLSPSLCLSLCASRAWPVYRYHRDSLGPHAAFSIVIEHASDLSRARFVYDRQRFPCAGAARCTQWTVERPVEGMGEGNARRQPREVNSAGGWGKYSAILESGPGLQPFSTRGQRKLA